MNPPNQIGNADLVAYVALEDKHIRTGFTEHWVGGKLVKDFYGLAICKYPNSNGYYLFYCDSAWVDITDTYHETIEDAIEHAEFEYTNTENDWVQVK